MVAGCLNCFSPLHPLRKLITFLVGKCSFLYSMFQQTYRVHNRAAVRKLDDDEKGGYSLHTPGGIQSVGIVNLPVLGKIISGRTP